MQSVVYVRCSEFIVSSKHINMYVTRLVYMQTLRHFCCKDNCKANDEIRILASFAASNTSICKSWVCPPLSSKSYSNICNKFYKKVLLVNYLDICRKCFADTMYSVLVHWSKNNKYIVSYPTTKLSKNLFGLCIQILSLVRYQY